MWDGGDTRTHATVNGHYRVKGAHTEMSPGPTQTISNKKLHDL